MENNANDAVRAFYAQWDTPHPTALVWYSADDDVAFFAYGDSPWIPLPLAKNA